MPRQNEKQANYRAGGVEIITVWQCIRKRQRCGKSDSEAHYSDKHTEKEQAVM